MSSVVGQAANLSAEEKAQAPALLDFVHKGGRLVILAQDDWQWKDLVDFSLDGKRHSSRGVPLRRCEAPAAYRHRSGIPETMEQPAGPTGRPHDPGQDPGPRRQAPVDGKPRPADRHQRGRRGKGEIVICMLDFGGCLGRSAKAHDPVAERIMLNLLAR